LSLAEKRLVMLAVAMIDSHRAVVVDTLPMTRITAAEYSELAKIEIDTAYQELKSACKKLYSRNIRFYKPADLKSRSNKPIEVDMRWVGEAHYKDNEGVVELYWWPRLIPFLTGLKNQFTTYQLQQATALRSMYSWRLLELLSQFKDTGLLIISVEEFTHAMDANEKQRADFAKIRTRMIEPAVKELIAKDGWDITWQAIKRGRTVATLRFEFDTKQPKPTKLPAPKAITSPVSPAVQPPPFVPEKPRTPEQCAKALKALAAAKKAVRGASE
jgi:plasmid replication initiation protein